MKCKGFAENIKNTYQPGRLPDMSNEEYRKIDAISASDLKEMNESIDRFVKKDKLIRPESTAMDVGTALHEALLEPDKFKFSNYRLKPKDAQALRAMINNAKAVFGKALSFCETEQSFIAFDDVFARKCRVDAIDKRGYSIVYDVKTSRYGNIKDFHRFDIVGRGYDIQAAWYLDVLNMAGFPAEHFIFLVVQNQAPYNVFAVEIHNSIIEKGRAKYSEILNRYLDYCNNKLILDVRTVYDWEYIKSMEV